MEGPSPTPERIAQYRILRSLGSGGMAKVFLAQDERLQRQVALKLLPRHGTDSIATEARFLQEARAAARLDHPNVCAIYEVGEAPEGNFIAMQLVEGETLAARMARRRLELAESLEIAIQVLDALAEAHARGIIHRDIKPANIMLTSRNQVKVLDFGLAKNTAPGGDPAHLGLTQSGMVVGTIPYMSPEQLKSERVDGRSDLFSTGTLLYEMVTGSRPFQARSGAEVMSAILKEAPPLLEGHEPVPTAEMPPALQRVLRHALEKDPQLRYPTAAAFREELVALRQGLGTSSEELTTARPVSGASGLMTAVLRSGQVLRRHQGVRWSLVTLLALLGLGAAAWFVIPAVLGQRQVIESIAVLPFVTAPGDTEAELLAEGLGDQLIRDLAQRPNLKVIARSSVMKYKGDDLDLRAVGKSLGVRALLVGRFILKGNRREISAELVDPSDLRQLWSDRYTFTLAELPEIQSRLLGDLTRRASRAIPDSRTPEKKRQLNSEAFSLYLQGKRASETMTLDGIQQGFAFMDQALRLDPGFALAHAHKSYAYMVLSHRFMPSSEAMRAMKTEAEKALALDPALPEAHTALAFSEAIFTRDYRKAEARFRRGIELAPGSAQAHELFGYFLSGMGRHAEAAAEIDLAVELDPISPRIFCVKGLSRVMARDWPAVVQAADRVLALEPSNAYAKTLKARIALRNMDGAQALKHLDGLPESDSSATFYRGLAMAQLGRKEMAIQLLKGQPGAMPTSAASSHAFRAIGEVALGNREAALHEIEKMVAQREEAVLFLNVEPFFDSLRKEERFVALLKQAGY